MTGRVYVNFNWERAAYGALSPYLTISRPDQPVERIPLTTQDVARLLADGAYLWAVVEPMRQGTKVRHLEHPHDHGDDGYAPHYVVGD